jgi:hypothetical protein
MKQVIFNKSPQGFIEPKQVKYDSIVGVIIYNDKGWVQCMEYGLDIYNVMVASSGVSHCNSWMHRLSMKEVMRWIGEDSDTRKAFVFETEKELFRWLSEPIC